MTTPAIDYAAVEAKLRQHAADDDPHDRIVNRMVSLALRSDRVRFWSGEDCESDFQVQALDAVGECERVALEVSARFGFQVCVGYAASDAHGPTVHCWNLRPDGLLVDAARARRRATGYLGIPLDQLEARRWAATLGLADPLGAPEPPRGIPPIGKPPQLP